MRGIAESYTISGRRGLDKVGTARISMTLSLQPYRFVANDGRAVAAELGSLVVPMRRSAPSGGEVRLAFVRLPAFETRPRPPVVFLSGGPGMSGIRSGRGRLFGLFDSLRAVGDVVLFDQRGSGDSAPSLRCREPLTLPFEQSFSKDEALRAAIDSTRRCAEHLAADGVDLGAFNTSESADDVADLVRALGAERASLLAWSYGTHLAFAVMRRHPELTYRAVLAGPEGPDHTYKLPSRIARQLETIVARARVDRVAPDLLETMVRVLDAVEKDAARVTLAGPDGSTRGVAVGRFDLEWMLAEGIADTRVLARWPLWFARMARGDFDAIGRDALLRGYFEELRTGLNRSLVRVCMDCASGASAQRWHRIEDEARTTLLGRTIDFPFPEICAAVGRPDLGDDFRAPLRSNAEVLFLTGTLDARTPADNVADLAPGFANHRHLVVEDAGHADLLLPSGVQRSAVEFLQNGQVAHERVHAEPPFRFETAQPMLLYDGECAFCRRQVERLRARVGGAVRFEPFQGAGDVAGVPTGELARAVHFVDTEGRVSSGAEAVYRTLAAGGRTARLWMYRHVPGFNPLSEWGYRVIARHRGLIARVFPRL
jgi:pimeloyl-ACP methyl ester carboxylesterase/predicted DCC family thiol-disulfide oxidoreductase YuxK